MWSYIVSIKCCLGYSDCINWCFRNLYFNKLKLPSFQSSTLSLYSYWSSSMDWSDCSMDWSDCSMDWSDCSMDWSDYDYYQPHSTFMSSDWIDVTTSDWHHF